ncbi:OmpA family protein [Marinoscillum sp. MHG1-6]|uniref:OmpA family protein n=1 Tax=Marinoscillum sp. MHG1-6 TaxID=2959627 RepID=UPI002157DA3F|nr:OmpA family protein [Marinoscillum sp. MHG1-6]
MNKLVFSALLVFLSLSILRAQETVIWGSKVIDVSSEYGRLGYSAIQALHKPNVFPSGGENPNAWRPSSEDREEFIVVAFDKPIKAKQVAIAESENPGAVKAVYGYNEAYDEYTLFELTPRALPIESRLLNLFFDDTEYEIYALKIVLDGEGVPGYNSIDAVGISSSNIPISVLINLVPGINEEVTTEKLGANVNSEYIEHSPIISPDGKRLYFSRKYHPDNVGGPEDPEDIWMSEMDEATGEWKPAVNLGPPLNTEGPNFISSLTLVDGEEVLILGNRYGKKGRMYSGLSVSKKRGDTFDKPESIEIQNEYNYSPKADFFLAPSGQAIITSVERDDSYGGRDLYVSFKNGDIWSEPLNLGDEINTAGEDFSPFLAQDGKILYYSTNGISGYGGSDIFVSMRLDDSWTNWSVPENLGAGVNSAEDDQYFSIPSSGKHIYFSRGDTDDDTDIFRFKAEDLLLDDSSPIASSFNHLTSGEDDVFVTVYGKVLDSKSGNEIPNARVIVERLPDGVDIGSIKTEGSDYHFTVRAGARYGLLAKLDGYLSRNENFDFNRISKSDSVNKDLMLTPIEKEAKIVINNIFFDFDKAVLKTSSYPELNRILEYLKSGDIAKIQISGHTDSVGDDAYNQGLSERRARAVFNYFRQNGVAFASMKVVGYGETEPIAPNDTDENKQLNRRVEFKILE